MLNASGPCVWTEGAALTVGSSLDARRHRKHLHRMIKCFEKQTQHCLLIKFTNYNSAEKNF